MLQMTRASFVCTESPDALDALRRYFDDHHALRLEQFLHPDLLAFVQASVRQASFYERDDDDIAREACMADNAMLAMMCLIMNDGHLFSAIHRITGCAPIGYFNGRVYALHADAGHYDRWHSDMSDDRRIGISINLSEGAFSGGVFELRRVTAEAAEWSAANTGPGDAVLFRISDDLRHRVTPVTGPVPRIAYAGWFQGGMDLLTFLKTNVNNAENTNESMQYTDPAATR
jgi:hypothetical protein